MRLASAGHEAYSCSIKPDRSLPAYPPANDLMEVCDGGGITSRIDQKNAGGFLVELNQVLSAYGAARCHT